jgi:ubiquinone/menaquinone biosynthesis C-methylase UbiE
MIKNSNRDISDLYTQFFYFSRFQAFTRALKKCSMFPLKGKKVCEVGCGSGQLLTDIVNWGVHATDAFGFDIDKCRVELVKKKLPASLIALTGAQQTPFRSHAFDIVFQATVFTSILCQSDRETAAKEMVRIVKPSGIILWYDFRFDNPWNKKVVGISRKEIRRLFPDSEISFSNVTLLPQLGRIMVPIWWGGAWYLEKLPLLCTHYLAIIHPPCASENKCRNS